MIRAAQAQLRVSPGLAKRVRVQGRADNVRPRACEPSATERQAAPGCPRLPQAAPGRKAAADKVPLGVAKPTSSHIRVANTARRRAIKNHGAAHPHSVVGGVALKRAAADRDGGAGGHSHPAAAACGAARKPATHDCGCGAEGGHVDGAAEVRPAALKLAAVDRGGAARDEDAAAAVLAHAAVQKAQACTDGAAVFGQRRSP